MSRCGTSTCSVCSRTCTVTAMSTPPTPLLCFSATPSPRPNSSQLPLDDSFDTFEGVDTDDLRARLTLDTHFPATSKRQSSSLTTSPPPKFDSDTRNSSWLDGPSLGGCGRVVCQPCAVEDLDRWAQIFHSLPRILLKLIPLLCGALQSVTSSHVLIASIALAFPRCRLTSCLSFDIRPLSANRSVRIWAYFGHFLLPHAYLLWIASYVTTLLFYCCCSVLCIIYSVCSLCNCNALSVIQAFTIIQLIL